MDDATKPAKELKPLDELIKLKTGLDRRNFCKNYCLSYDTVTSLSLGRKGCSLAYASEICRKLNCSFKDLALALGLDTSGIPD